MELAVPIPTAPKDRIVSLTSKLIPLSLLFLTTLLMFSRIHFFNNNINIFPQLSYTHHLQPSLVLSGMNDPTHRYPFTCHGSGNILKIQHAAAAPETVLHGSLDKNHCQEVHVANAEFKQFWDAVGNWKYTHYARGNCDSAFDTKDSITHDKNWPTAILIKKGKSSVVGGVDKKNVKVLHEESKDHCSEVHIPKKVYKAFWADKGWSFKGYAHGKCERTWNTKDTVTHDAKYKGVTYVKKGRNKVLTFFLGTAIDTDTVLHEESKAHCSEVHIPASVKKAFWADKSWSFKSYSNGECESAWTTEDSITRDAKYKDVTYIKKGKGKPTPTTSVVLHAASKAHCAEVHIPGSIYSSFWADKGWSFKGYKHGECESTWNTEDKVTHDTKYKGVTYVKKGRKTFLRSDPANA
jgi:phosphopantetheinyl transferase (holo-ACP synthase)